MPTLSAIKRVHAGRQSLESYILGLGPVGYWRLNELSGTVAEDIGSGGNNGTYVGGVTLGVNSPVPARVLGNARVADFNGSNQHIVLSDPTMFYRSQGEDITFWALADFDSTAAVQSVFSGFVGGASDEFFFLAVTNDPVFRFRFRDRGVNLVTADTVTPATTGIHSIVGVRDTNADQAIIYLDGNFENAVADTTTLEIESPTAWLGESPTGQHDFNGRLLGFACFHRVVTLAEIEALHLIAMNGA